MCRKPVTDDLITRQQFAELCGISRSKTFTITRATTINFPAQLGFYGRADVWDKKEVLKWLENNDPTQDFRTLQVENRVRTSTLDNKLAHLFLTHKSGAQHEPSAL